MKPTGGNDFLLGLGIAVGGAFALNALTQTTSFQAMIASQDKQNCAAPNQWMTGTVNGIVYGSHGICTDKTGAPLMSSTPSNPLYLLEGPTGLAIPAALALLITQSGSGALGAAIGIVGVFLYGISGIH